MEEMLIDIYSEHFGDIEVLVEYDYDEEQKESGLDTPPIPASVNVLAVWYFNFDYMKLADENEETYISETVLERH